MGKDLGRTSVYRATNLLNLYAHLGCTKWWIDKGTLDVVNDDGERIDQAEAVRLAEQYKISGKAAK